jgi:naphthoate synthase
MVNKVVPLEMLEDETIDWCNTMLERSPMALRMLKRAFNAELDGQHGLMELAGDATLLYYLTKKPKKANTPFWKSAHPISSSFPSSLNTTEKH